MDAILVVNAAAHLLTDAVCAAALFGPAGDAGHLAAAVLLYNTLAFSTQCVVGLLTDGAVKQPERLAGAALLAVALGFFLPLPWLPRVCVIGLGNSLFHVAAGTVTLENAGGKAAPLGVFVAPGAVGLAVGTLFPGAGNVLAGLALILAGIMLRFPAAREPNRPQPRTGKTPWLAAAALLLAVAVRAVGGAGVSFPWKTGAGAALLLAGFVLAGKAAGGFLCDRLGARRSAWLSLPAAALLVALCGQWAAPALAGQLLLNLTMPVTLWLLYRALPDAPGFAFGLSASALWPGTLLGQYIRLTGVWQAGLVALCFLFGLAAILYSQRKIREVCE